MQSPIPNGTSLQNRYRLRQILGQGGFGRTYLAEDRGRFDELCAIKEFIPSQANPAFGQKARELFHREAAILYQIDHPQIPKFRAHFEEEGRLFLVQDYVAGKTYRKKLQERISFGETFSEAEIRHLIAKLLPVLDAIHHRGIIHRDISPENIIYRDASQTASGDALGSGGVETSNPHMWGDPVLIDFGVGKELAAPAATTNAITGASLGKIGYAPAEQIQSGRAYPSSDLYALAVTAIVLLTGVEPQQLFDDTGLIWQWEKFLVQDVSPELTKILNRMLQLRPGDRYQTAKEVILALAKTASPLRSANPRRGDLETSGGGDGGTSETGRRGEEEMGRLVQRFPSPEVQKSPSPPIPEVPWSRSPLVPPNLQPDVSEVPTIVAPKPSLAQLFWENNTAVAALTIFLMLLSGLGSWVVVSQLAKQQPPSPSVVEPTPGLSDIPTIPQLPIPTATPTGQPQGTTPTTTPTPSSSRSPSLLSQSQKEEEEEPAKKSTPEAKPVFYNQPLELDAGKPTTAEGNLKSHETIRYILDANAGEQLSLTLSGNGVLMNVFAPNGQAVDDRAQWISQWQGTLPSTGKYTLEISPVYGLADNSYKIDVLLNRSKIATPATGEGSGELLPPGEDPSRNLGTDPSYLPPVLDAPPPEVPESEDRVTLPAAPIATTERLIFPAGQNTLAVSDRTAPQQPKRYLVYVEKGQTLKLSSKSGAVGLDVRYPNGQLIEDAAMMVFWEGTVPKSGEYQIDVVSDDAVNYTLEVTVK